MSESGQVDLDRSRLKTAGLLIFSCGCSALLFIALNSRYTSAGSLNEFLGYLVLVLCAGATIRHGMNLCKSGTVISVNLRGIFDRRLSNDWIPWEAIEDIEVGSFRLQKWLMLKISPDRAAALPLRASARMLMNVNSALGFRSYTVSAADLEGGFDALFAAISVSRPNLISIGGAEQPKSS